MTEKNLVRIVNSDILTLFYSHHLFSSSMGVLKNNNLTIIVAMKVSNLAANGWNRLDFQFPKSPILRVSPLCELSGSSMTVPFTEFVFILNDSEPFSVHTPLNQGVCKEQSAKIIQHHSCLKCEEINYR